MKKIQEIIKNKNQKHIFAKELCFGLFVLSFVLLFSVVSFSLTAAKADAATGINRQINFQGKLVDNNGLNVADSTYTVVFSLYSVSSGGTNIWTETDSVTTKAGIFQVALGATTPLPDNVYFNSDSLYLGITVGSDAEMTPRIRFTAVPYALNAASLNGVTATQSANGFNLTGGTSSSSIVSFTTAAGALTLQPGVSEGLTIDTNGANTLSLGASANAINFGGSNNPTYHLQGTGGLTIDGTSLTLGNSSNATIQTTNGSNAGLTLLSQGSGNITLGQNAGNGDVVISPNAGGQAALIIKDLGSGDLFTASAGATTKFTVDKTGDIIFAGGQTNANSTITSLATSAQNYTLPSQGGTFCLSINNCGFATGTNYWQLLTNALSPGNSTYDFLLGGNSTASARFAFINNSGATTPVASISANSGNNATYLAGNGTLGTTNGQSLTLGSSGNVNFFNANNTITNSGNLSLSGANGITLSGAGADINFTGTGTDSLTTQNNSDLTLMPNGTGHVGINVSSNLLATFDVRGNSGTTPVASVAGATTNAAEIVDQSGSGDIFTASKSGATKFVIANDGTIGLDTANYNACGVLATDANGNIYCSNAGAKETIAGVYTITAPAGNNLHITFTGAAGSAVSSISGTITFPANITKFSVTLKGAGGGGGGITATGAVVKAGGGGGEGGYSQRMVTSVASDYYVKVGGGGLGGTTAGGNGGPGTATCIGTSSTDACSSPLASATGGNGGNGNSTGTAVPEPGGVGGVGANGDLNQTGQAGGASGAVSTAEFSGFGGGIGGAVGRTTVGAGNSGSNGGGASGGLETTAVSTTGGNGGNGYLSITYYTNSNTASTGDGWYQYLSGVLAPMSATTDVLIGSNATASAEFGFLNVNSGIPTASISAVAQATGATYLTANGVLQTTNNQTLTIGGSTTGNIIINPSSNSLLGIGTTTPHADIDINGGAETIPVASIAGQTSFAAMVVNNSGVGDLFTASKSGATKFTVLNNGNISWSGANNVLSTFASAATSAQTWTLPNATGTICVSTNNCGFASGTNEWQQTTGGALTPTTITDDLLVGGLATASARFAIINMVGTGTPTASISANNGNTATFLTGTGILGTTNNQTLTIGGSTTGNIIINPSSNSLLGVGTTAPHADLDVFGGAGTIPAASLSAQSSFASLVVNNSGAGDLFTASKSGATKFTILNNGNIAFAGTNTALSTLASAATSAQTWTLPNATGTLCLSTNNCGFASGTNEWQQINGAISPTTITDDIVAGGSATSSARFSVINMVGTGTPTASLSAGTSGGAYMTAGGVIQTTANQTLTLGGTTTGNILLNPAAGNYVGIDTINPLATLDVRNALSLNGGTVAVASISGKTSFAALVVNNTGPGDIFTASSSGLTRLVVTQNGAMGIGTRTPQATYLDISENSAATFVPTKDFVDIGNAAGQEPTVSGVNAMQLSWFGKPATGNTSSAEHINITNNNTATGGRVNGMRVVATGVGGAINSNTDGLYIDGLANASRGTTGQNAIEIGTNWDSSIYGQGDLRINAGGNIILATSSATTRIGIGTTTPLATLDVRGNSASTPAASVAATSNFAAMVVNNSGKGDIFAASKSGATKFVVNSAGNVGIGTAAPLYGLDVQAVAAATAAAQIYNTSTGVSAVGLQIKLGATGTIPTTNRWINFMNGNGQILGKVRGNASGTTVAFDGNGGDFAEYFKKSPNAGDLHPGDLVCQGIDGVEKCTNNGDGILGIISDDAAFIGAGGHEDDPNYVLVGLVGQLRVNVASASGIVQAGDPLTFSSTPGVVMKATQAGQIIGRALENYDPSTSTDNRVLTSIAIQWYSPMVPSDGNYDLLQNADLSVFDSSSSAAASDSGVLQPLYTIQTGAGIAVSATTAFAKATIATIQAGAVVAKQISTDQLSVTSGTIMLGGQTLDDHIKRIIKQTLSERDQTKSGISVDGLVTATQSAQLIQTMLEQKDLSATVSGMIVSGVLGVDTITTKHIEGLTDLDVTTVAAASISAQTITADTITAKHIAGLDIITNGLQKDDARITALENLVATPSAAPATVEQPTISPTEGITLLSDTPASASVSGDLHVKGNGLIEGILHVVDTLFTNNIIANGISEFFGNAIFHSGVTFEKTPTFNSDTAGIAVIKKGTDHIDVRFANDYDQIPVVNISITLNPLTPTPSETPDAMKQRQNDLEKALLSDNVRFVITNRTVHGFTILLENPANEDIAFSWLALAVQNPTIFQSVSSASPTPSEALSPSPIDSIMPSDMSLTPTIRPTEGSSQ